MRVWLWGELFWPYIGGAELFAAHLMLALRPRGYEFAVVTSHDHLDLPDQGEYRGIPIFRFPFRSSLRRGHIEELASVRRRVAALKRELAPDLIHLNGVTPNAFFCVNSGGERRVPLLVRLNQEAQRMHAGPIAGSLLENVLHRATWVTSVSRTLLDDARQLVPAITPYSSVIYNGVDAPADPPAAPPLDPPHILCLGRLVENKGFDVALRAFAALRERRGARLIIAGDGPERGALQAQAEALDLGASVEFPGWVAPEAVPQLMSRAALVAVPSRREGLPSVALEAAAMGRPIVATRVGGLPELVLDGHTGVLVDLDVTALSAAFDRLLAQPDRARQMGQAAWRHIREHFSGEQCVNAYDALYRRVAALPAA